MAHLEHGTVTPAGAGQAPRAAWWDQCWDSHRCSRDDGGAEDSEAGVRLRNADRCQVTTGSRRTGTKAPGCLGACPPWLRRAGTGGGLGSTAGQCWSDPGLPHGTTWGQAAVCWHRWSHFSFQGLSSTVPRTPATLTQRLPCLPAPPSLPPPACPPSLLPQTAPPAYPRLSAPPACPCLPAQQI